MRGHIRQRGDKWVVVIDLGKDATGKRRQRWVTVTGGKKAAYQKRNELLAEVGGATPEPEKQTVEAYLSYWLKHVKRHVAPKTYERYEEVVTKHLQPALGKQLLAKLSPVQIQDYEEEALVSGRRDGRGGLSAQTVLHHHRILSAALNQAVTWGKLRENPVRRVTPPKPVDREPPSLDPDAAARLLLGILQHRHYLPVFMALTTSLRMGEVLALHWKDVDLERGSLEVTCSLEETKAGGLRFKPPKRKDSERHLTMLPLLTDALREHRDSRRDSFPLVHCQEDGAPWAVSVVSKAFEHIAARAGVPEVRFHDLRHNHITLLILLGVDVGTIQRRAGHARKSTTLDVYGRAFSKAQRNVADERAAALVDTELRAALARAGKVFPRAGALPLLPPKKRLSGYAPGQMFAGRLQRRVRLKKKPREML